MARTAAKRARGRPAAKADPYPGFIEPCHPTLVDRLPGGDGWLHEIKADGYRAQIHSQEACNGRAQEASPPNSTNSAPWTHPGHDVGHDKAGTISVVAGLLFWPQAKAVEGERTCTEFARLGMDIQGMFCPRRAISRNAIGGVLP
jgi:hypothetical protein